MQELEERLLLNGAQAHLVEELQNLIPFCERARVRETTLLAGGQDVTRGRFDLVQHSAALLI